MALINCSMSKSTVLVTSGTSNVTSVELEITPNTGFVVAARDFLAGNNPDAVKIQSITLSDSLTAGGPQNDGSYATGNKVKVTVDFVNGYAFTENTTLDIDPSGNATADYLVPVKVQGTFAVPASPSKVAFTPSSVVDFGATGSAVDFYVYDNPGKTVDVMTMTIDATSGDFVDEDTAISIANSSYALVQEEYVVSRSETLSAGRLTQVVYTVKVKMPNANRNSDVITFSGSGLDIPGTDNKIYGFSMDTSAASADTINRRLEIEADAGSKFRIKMERGTLSGSTFTIDANDGIYVFDNTRLSIATAFEASSSTTTYPSEINQANGTYDPATDPYTMGASGSFYKDIFIPADSTDKIYRFTILPQGTTTVDLTAVGINTVPDPDTITFDIVRVAEVYIEATYNSATIRQGLTATTEYFDYKNESKGTTKPAGLANKEVSSQINNYNYEVVITDDADFHLPNQKNAFALSDLNYTKTLNSGIVSNPVITAELKHNSDGFNVAEIGTTGYNSHTHAQAHEVDTVTAITENQREALTNKTSFSLINLKDLISIVGTDVYFKLAFFTTDDIPAYKTQTIRILPDYQVQGEEGQSNTTARTAPAVDRTKLYLKGDSLSVSQWGTSNMSIRKDLDTFASTSAQVVNTLDVSLDVAQGVREFINSTARSVGYVYDSAYYIDRQVSTDGGSVYGKQNITSDNGSGVYTTHVKFTVSGAFLIAQDGLPADFNVNNYELVFEPSNFSNELSNVTVAIAGQPTLTLTNSGGTNRLLTLSNFTVVIDFGSTLSSLSTTQSYFYNTAIIHKLSNQYRLISEIESEYYPDFPESPLASY
tara:strand:+ start:7286 stop:9760 length:2475 start_codon:yes stop_codon:yes gene_type:complete